MTDKAISPLRQSMIEDMTVRGFMPRHHAIAEATTYFDDAAPAGAADH